MKRWSMLAVLSLLIATPCAWAGQYTYWQVTIDKDGHRANPIKLTTIERDAAPSKAHPIEVKPKAVEGAKSYEILRIPSVTPAVPKVEVKNKGNDTLYYWLIGHTGRTFSSPIAGPAVAQNCDASHLDNVVTWDKTAPYDTYTILRTRSAEVPAGQVNALIAWHTKATHLEDRRSGLLTLYDALPRGTASSTTPVNRGAFLVGTSQGEPVADIGELKRAKVPMIKMREEHDGQIEARNLEQGDAAINIHTTNDKPSGKYTWGGPVGLYIYMVNLAGGHNDYSLLGGGPHAKSFSMPFWLWQIDYTAGQVANFVNYCTTYGEGDNVIFTTHTSTQGLTADGGDEGTEIFMASASRGIQHADYTLAADAPLHATMLDAPHYKRSGTGRVVVNLTQAVSAGKIVHIDDDMKVNPKLSDRNAPNRVTRFTGKGTKFTPEMLGWYISLDCDTTHDGVRQWYRIIRVNSPTSIDIYAYTFFSGSTYLGHASNVEYHGLKYRGGYKFEPRPKAELDRPAQAEAYLLAPATAIADPSMVGNKLHVLPLKQPWHKGDKIRITAGPQTALSIGKLSVGGKLMPQDFVSGLTIMNNTDRLSNDGALYIMGAWNHGMDLMLDRRGLSSGIVVTGAANPTGGAFVAPADTNALKIAGTPIVLAGLSETGETVFADQTHDGRKILAMTPKTVTLGQDVTLRAGNMVRGRATFSGNAKATTYTVKFPGAYDSVPYVVASANLPLGMGVTQTTANGFTVTFAQAPPAGEQNVVVTWIVMQ